MEVPRKSGKKGEKLPSPRQDIWNVGFFFLEQACDVWSLQAERVTLNVCDHSHTTRDFLRLPGFPYW